jgi:hypothetical protein
MASYSSEGYDICHNPSKAMTRSKPMMQSDISSHTKHNYERAEASIALFRKCQHDKNENQYEPWSPP